MMSFVLKWTDGKPHERSNIATYWANCRAYEEQTNAAQEQYNNQQAAYLAALYSDESVTSAATSNGPDYWAKGGYVVENSSMVCKSTKREDLDKRLAVRDPIRQIGSNPFLGNNNYVNDIAVCDKFLKPVNTSNY